MVTETTLQRRIAEAFIEHCHYFFPDLPEAQTPIKSSASSPPLTYRCTSPTSSSSSTSTSLQSYTKTSDGYAGSSPYSSPVYPSLDSLKATFDPPKPKENLPHPLADSASDEGVTVDMVEGGISPKLQRNISSPAPSDSRTPRPVPPPIAPRTSSSTNITPPPSPSFNRNNPSPSPRPRHAGLGNRSSGGEYCTGNEALANQDSGDSAKADEPLPPR